MNLQRVILGSVVIVIGFTAFYERSLQKDRQEKEKIFSKMCDAQNGIVIETRYNYQCVSTVILTTDKS